MKRLRQIIHLKIFVAYFYILSDIELSLHDELQDWLTGATPPISHDNLLKSAIYGFQKSP
jgi:hypothetical protein